MDVKMNDMFMKSINYNKFCGLKLTVILPLIMSVFRGLGVAQQWFRCITRMALQSGIPQGTGWRIHPQGGLLASHRGAVCWRKTSVSLHVVLSIGLECPKGMAAGFLQGKNSKIQGRRSMTFMTQPQKSEAITFAIFYWSNRPPLIKCGRDSTKR